MYAELIRRHFSTQQTRGEFILYDERGKVLFNCKTLELDVDGNKEGESCIPEGTYTMVPLKSRPDSVTFSKQKQGYFPYLVRGVPNRSGILFHHGNYHEDILGCILVGNSFYDLDGDGLMDVRNSRSTMKELNEALKTPVELTIKRSNIDRKGVENVYLRNDSVQ